MSPKVIVSAGLAGLLWLHDVPPCPGQEAKGQTRGADRIEPDVEVEAGEPDPPEMFRQLEQCLRRIQGRVVGDRDLQGLSSARVSRRVDGPDFTLRITAATRNQIVVPVRGVPSPFQVAGDVSLSIEHAKARPEDITQCGPDHGVVQWETGNPNIFVKMYWLSSDPGIPDRLLAILREELNRDGIHLTPVRRNDGPVATTAERLSRLIPLDSLPPPAPDPKTQIPASGTDQAVFASPHEVATAYLKARASRDSRAYYRCLTPSTQASIFRHLLSVLQLDRRSAIGPAKAIEDRLRIKMFDENFQLLDREEIERFFFPPGKPFDGPDETTDAWLFESIKNRVGDVPGFLADCIPEFPEPLRGEDVPTRCAEIRVEGDRASGYSIEGKPAPPPDELSPKNVLRYLPLCVPIRFRRIGASWFVTFAFGGEY